MNYDLEDFRDYFLNLIKDNIDAKIDAINTAKADSITLKKPASEHFVSDINDQALAFDPFIHYGFSEIKTRSQGGVVQWTPTMFFAFYFISRDKGDVAESKVLRYTKAMAEIIAENFSKNAIISNVEILPLPPTIVIFSDMDGSEYKVGAIEIKGSFVA